MTNFKAVTALSAVSLLLAGCSSVENMKGYASNMPASGSVAEQPGEQQTASVQSATDQNDIIPAAGGDEISDPLETTNRMFFKFNKGVDKVVIHPVVKGYRAVVPKPARMGLRNFLRNLKSPTTFANQLLQGDIGGAGEVLARTAINSTVGIGGLIDVAGEFGMPYEAEDFGQTMAVWGVGHGPYMVVPILGPSSLRDYAGYFVDSYADPLRWWAHNTDNEGWYYAKLGLDYLDLRESLVDVLEDLEKSSVDYYASVRSVYYQRREAMVNDEAGQASPDFDEFQ